MLIPPADLRLRITAIVWEKAPDGAPSAECPDTWFRFQREADEVAVYLYRTRDEAEDPGQHPLRSKVGQARFPLPESGTICLSLPITDDPGEPVDYGRMTLQLRVEELPLPWFAVWGYVGPSISAE